ncbi:flavin reductase [Nonomuraea antimicrobica]
MDPGTYRKVVGRFATGVAIVTTRVGDVDHAMTINSFTSVSLEPLLVLFCAEKVSRFHDAVLEAGTWGSRCYRPRWRTPRASSPTVDGP